MTDLAPLLERHSRHDHDLARVKAALIALLPGDILYSGTRVIPANGVLELEFRTPYRAVSADNRSALPITLAAAPPGDRAPASGPGVAVLAALATKTVNMEGYTLSVYGNPGDQVVLQVTDRPWAPAAAMMAAVAITTITPLAASSVTAHGSAAAPAAGAAIATTVALPNGLYRVELYRYFSAGAPVAGDADNIVLQIGGSTVLVPCTPPALNSPNPAAVWQGRANNQAASANAAGIGTAGVTYNATVVATQIGA